MMNLQSDCIIIQSDLALKTGIQMGKEAMTLLKTHGFLLPEKETKILFKFKLEKLKFNI